MNGLTGTKTVLAGSDWPLGPGQIQMSPARSPAGQAQATSRGVNQNIKNKVQQILILLKLLFLRLSLNKLYWRLHI